MFFYRTTLLALLLCFLGSNLQAQETEIRRRTIQINDGAIDNEPEYEYDRFLIKVNPILLMIGDFPVSLEYAFTDWLTMEAGVGVTTRDYLRESLFDGIFNTDDLEYTVPLGFSYMHNIKIVPSGDVYDDAGYFLLQFNYRRYNMSLSVDPSLTLDGVNQFDLNRITREWGVGYGYYLATDIDGLIIDYYLGFTIKSGSIRQLDYEYDNNGSQYYYTSESPTENTIGGLFGIKIGYNF